MNSIRVSSEIIAQFSEHAVGEYPHECCGFLIGTFDDNGSTTVEYLPGINTKSTNRERRFLIDPLDYQNAEDKAEAKNMSIIGILHSHPDHPDIPSEFDRLHAFPGFSYVIISVMDGKISGYRSWQLRNDRSAFDPESIGDMELVTV